MDQEKLAALGLSAAQIEGVMAETEGAVSAERAKREAAEQALAEALAAGETGLREEVEVWKERALAHQQQAEEARFEAALEGALREAGARHPAAVRGMLDLTGVELVQGKLSGLAEPLAALRREHGYLFAPQGSGGPAFSGKAAPLSQGLPNELMNALLRGTRGE